MINGIEFRRLFILFQNYAKFTNDWINYHKVTIHSYLMSHLNATRSGYVSVPNVSTIRL